VLEASIRRRTQNAVEIVPMIGPRWEYDTTGFQQGTGFSLRRWMIPAYCNWQGYAIYLDADQIVLSDIHQLWDTQQAGCVAAMTFQPSKHSEVPHPNSSVMLLNCELARELPFFDLPQLLAHLRANPTKADYVKVMYPTWLLAGRLPVEWNHLNVYEPGKTKLLHYTREPDQPWYKPEHPLAYLWKQELEYTIKNGYIQKADFEAALKQWGVKQDWRNQNGLHHKYKKYLRLFK
jgi:hypothetical protein